MTTADPTTTTPTPITAVSAPSKTLGILSLVSAGLSIFTGHLFVFAIAAVVLGIIGFRREPAGRTLSTWGIIVGSVMIVLPLVIVGMGLALLVPFAIWGGMLGH